MFKPFLFARNASGNIINNEKRTRQKFNTLNRFKNPPNKPFFIFKAYI